ncbi:MAG: hypothetical protein KIS81_11525 [Maricaulaceae bacterium]|nr:hypothetical protein [Maricaulaceae bacterium]
MARQADPRMEYGRASHMIRVKERVAFLFGNRVFDYPIAAFIFSETLILLSLLIFFVHVVFFSTGDYLVIYNSTLDLSIVRPISLGSALLCMLVSTMVRNKFGKEVEKNKEKVILSPGFGFMPIILFISFVYISFM